MWIDDSDGVQVCGKTLHLCKRGVRLNLFIFNSIQINFFALPPYLRAEAFSETGISSWTRVSVPHANIPVGILLFACPPQLRLRSAPQLTGSHRILSALLSYFLSRPGVVTGVPNRNRERASPIFWMNASEV